MIPNQIRKVLSSIANHEVRALLMGGQACILYGAAEFSRDIDFAILASNQNLDQLRLCLVELEAEVIAVPPSLSLDFLERGHAIHFRCATPEAAGLRVDVMTKLRGVDEFDQLWQRRNKVISDDGTVFHLMSLQDLVKAKKTQRDKDWPMVRRLVEADYFANHEERGVEQIEFWFRELRTPSLLIELASEHPDLAEHFSAVRPLLKYALLRDDVRLADGLSGEERAEREADELYWRPLKAELEQLRRDRRSLF